MTSMPPVFHLCLKTFVRFCRHRCPKTHAPGSTEGMPSAATRTTSAFLMTISAPHLPRVYNPTFFHVFPASIDL